MTAGSPTGSTSRMTRVRNDTPSLLEVLPDVGSAAGSTFAQPSAARCRRCPPLKGAAPAGSTWAALESDRFERSRENPRAALCRLPTSCIWVAKDPGGRPRAHRNPHPLSHRTRTQRNDARRGPTPHDSPHESTRSTTMTTDTDRCETRRGEFRCDYLRGHRGECETRQVPAAWCDKQCHARSATPFLQSRVSEAKDGQ